MIFRMMLAFFLAAFSPSAAYADFEMEGYLKDSSGNPLSGTYRLWASVEKENDPNCVLYREEFNGVATGADGSFVLTIGAGIRTTGFTTTLESTLGNLAPLQCRDRNGAATAIYGPDDDDVRKLSIDFEVNPGNVVAVGRTRLAPVPYANYAFRIGGHTVGSLLRVMDNGAPHTVPALTPTQHSELLNVLSGSSSSYLRSNTASGAVMPSYSGGTSPSSAQPGSLWYDSAQKVMKYFDGTTSYILPSSTDASGILPENRGGTGVSSLADRLLLKGGQPGPVDFGSADASAVNLKVNGLTMLTASASGAIGIGTGTPSHRLTVYDTGSGPIANFRNTSNNAAVAIDTSVGRRANLLFTKFGNARWSLGYDALTESSSTSGSNFRLSRYDNSGNLLGESISVNREDGKVGVGVSDPQAMLDVGGSIRIGDGAEACVPGNVGFVRTNTNRLMFCDGSTWKILADAASMSDKLDKALPSGQIFVGDTSNNANAVGLTGDASLTAAGFLTVTRIQGSIVSTAAPANAQALLFNGSAYVPAYINSSYLKNQNGSAGLLTSANCTASKTMYFDSGDGALKCQNISLDTNSLSSGVLPTSRGGTGTTTPEDTFVLKGGQVGAVSLGSKSLHSLQFLTNNSSRMVLDQNGNLGLGTTTPGSRLQVEGNSTLNGNVNAKGNIYFTDATNPQELSTFDYNGILNLKLSRSTGIMPDGPDKLSFFSYDGFDFRTGASFSPGSYYPFSIRASGNVGINTTNPQAKLDVNGRMIIRNSSELELHDSTGNHYSRLVHNAGGHLHIDSFGGGGTSINWYGGVETFIGNGAGALGKINAAFFSTSSDRRLKQDIQPLAAALWH